ncbi:Nibrin [Eumeta japonica]|uniref:Nibrin n=1 Tax=Eumeta variegata TaxID=151549 RepID=A0A4C1XSS2_EUMVA|nr:Nibrin [Eumeta japonica]
MWFVKSENTERAFYFTPLCTNIVIGRKLDPDPCNFSISDDASISRKHATLFLKDNCLGLQDLESTYGTYINDSIEMKQKIKPEDVIILKEADIIKFGKLNSLWKVNKVDLVTCTSTLKGENLQSLKVILTKLGGVLKNEWDENCGYLTMPAITLTIKVVLALVYGSHIVTPEFWNKCLEAILSQTSLPDPKDFVPDVAESTLNKEVVSFLPDQRRKTLFQDAEIGLGILHCSLEKYCNPQFIFPSEVLRQSTPSDDSVKSCNILAQETQDITERNTASKRIEKTIEESLLSNEIQEVFVGLKKSDNIPNLKRKLSNDSNAQNSNAPKKHATEGNGVTVNQDDDIFNFIPPNNIGSSTNNKKTEKTLDFLKPHKRKINTDIPDDDLFNFLPNKNVPSDHTADETVKSKADSEDSINDMPRIKRLRLDSLKTNSVNISALRGIKLQELKYDGNGWKSCPKIKKEDISADLDSKMSHVDLGTTVVTIRRYDIIERNICFSENSTVNQIVNSKVQNFKKFKKVWPLKTQIKLSIEPITATVNKIDSKEVVSEA